MDGMEEQDADPDADADPDEETDLDAAEDAEADRETRADLDSRLDADALTVADGDFDRRDEAVIRRLVRGEREALGVTSGLRLALGVTRALRLTLGEAEDDRVEIESVVTANKNMLSNLSIFLITCNLYNQISKPLRITTYKE